MVVMWCVIGVLLFMGELFSPAFVLFFFGVGAWCAAGAAALGYGLPLCLAVFGIASIASLLLLRGALVSVFQGRSRASSVEASEGAPVSRVGEQGVVTRAIRPEEVGEISLGGSFWRAVSETTLEEGCVVRVVGHLDNDDLTLQVRFLSAGVKHE